MKPLIFIALLSIAVFCPGYSSEALSPDDIIPISSEREKRMGESIAKQVEKKFKVVEDASIQKRFEGIGKRIAAIASRQEFVYHFRVLEAKEGEDREKYYNAFTLPGGYIYMFEPLFTAMETDDKIAAVTAHEVGHISARHVVTRLQSSLGTNIVMLLALAMAPDGRTIAKANEAITQLMMSYSREDEFEADRLAVKYLKKSGFNPDGALESLLTLKKLRKKGPDLTYHYYRSHPYLSERIASVRSEIRGYMDFESYINLPYEKNNFD